MILFRYILYSELTNLAEAEFLSFSKSIDTLIQDLRQYVISNWQYKSAIYYTRRSYRKKLNVFCKLPSPKTGEHYIVTFIDLQELNFVWCETEQQIDSEMQYDTE